MGNTSYRCTRCGFTDEIQSYCARCRAREEREYQADEQRRKMREWEDEAIRLQRQRFAEIKKLQAESKQQAENERQETERLLLAKTKHEELLQAKAEHEKLTQEIEEETQKRKKEREKQRSKYKRMSPIWKRVKPGKVIKEIAEDVKKCAQAGEAILETVDTIERAVKGVFATEAEYKPIKQELNRYNNYGKQLISICDDFIKTIQKLKTAFLMAKHKEDTKSEPGIFNLEMQINEMKDELNDVDLNDPDLKDWINETNEGLEIAIQKLLKLHEITFLNKLEVYIPLLKLHKARIGLVKQSYYDMVEDYNTFIEMCNGNIDGYKKDKKEIVDALNLIANSIPNMRDALDGMKIKSDYYSQIGSNTDKPSDEIDPVTGILIGKPIEDPGVALGAGIGGQVGAAFGGLPGAAAGAIMGACLGAVVSKLLSLFSNARMDRLSSVDGKRHAAVLRRLGKSISEQYDELISKKQDDWDEHKDEAIKKRDIWKSLKTIAEEMNEKTIKIIDTFEDTKEQIDNHSITKATMELLEIKYLKQFEESMAKFSEEMKTQSEKV